MQIQIDSKIKSELSKLKYGILINTEGENLVVIVYPLKDKKQTLAKEYQIGTYMRFFIKENEVNNILKEILEDIKSKII